MAKQKTVRFKSSADGLVSIIIPGREPLAFQPGSDFETDDPVLVDVLRQNPDLDEVDVHAASHSSHAKGGGSGSKDNDK